MCFRNYCYSPAKTLAEEFNSTTLHINIVEIQLFNQDKSSHIKKKRKKDGTTKQNKKRIEIFVHLLFTEGSSASTLYLTPKSTMKGISGRQLLVIKNNDFFFSAVAYRIRQRGVHVVNYCAVVEQLLVWLAS